MTDPSDSDRSARDPVAGELDSVWIDADPGVRLRFRGHGADRGGLLWLEVRRNAGPAVLLPTAWRWSVDRDAGTVDVRRSAPPMSVRGLETLRWAAGPLYVVLGAWRLLTDTAGAADVLLGGALVVAGIGTLARRIAAWRTVLRRADRYARIARRALEACVTRNRALAPYRDPLADPSAGSVGGGRSPPHSAAGGP